MYVCFLEDELRQLWGCQKLIWLKNKFCGSITQQKSPIKEIMEYNDLYIASLVSPDSQFHLPEKYLETMSTNSIDLQYVLSDLITQNYSKHSLFSDLFMAEWIKIKSKVKDCFLFGLRLQSE